MNPTWPQRIPVIVFTAITGLLLGVIVFLARESLLVITIALSTNAYLPRAMDKIYLIVLGLIWLLSWFVFEGYLNGGVAKKNVLARFLVVLGWELVALFVFSIAAYLFTESGVNWTAVGLLSAAFIAGIALLYTARRMFSAPQKT